MLAISHVELKAPAPFLLFSQVKIVPLIINGTAVSPPASIPCIALLKINCRTD